LINSVHLSLKILKAGKEKRSIDIIPARNFSVYKYAA
jgi:hypothetical protein